MRQKAEWYRYSWFYISADLFWMRFWPKGPGFSIKKTPLLFSEREGHKKYIRLPCGWRLVYVERFI